MYIVVADVFPRLYKPPSSDFFGGVVAGKNTNWTLTDYSGQNVANLPGSLCVLKKSVQVQVNFAKKPGVVQTLEGPVAYSPSQALVKGVEGEMGPVELNDFSKNTNPLPLAQVVKTEFI